jgi:hypothetical protein
MEERYPEVIFEADLAYAVRWKDGSNVGDILGTRKRCLGMVSKLLTDARETSYWILSSLLSRMLYR